MQKIATLGTLLAVLILSGAGTVQAQEQAHTITDRQLTEAVSAEAEREAGDRQLLKRILQNEQVQNVAEKAGLDVERAIDGVDQLDDSEAQRLATMAEDVKDDLAGGNTLTITASTLGIVLLIILLILLV